MVGQQSFQAYTGREALGFLEYQKVDLVLLDTNP